MVHTDGISLSSTTSLTFTIIFLFPLFPSSSILPGPVFRPDTGCSSVAPRSSCHKRFPFAAGSHIFRPDLLSVPAPKGVVLTGLQATVYIRPSTYAFFHSTPCRSVSTYTVYSVSGPACIGLPSGSTAILPGWCCLTKAYTCLTPGTVCAGAAPAVQKSRASNPYWDKHRMLLITTLLFKTSMRSPIRKPIQRSAFRV